MVVLEAAKAVSNDETTLAAILSQMSELAKSLPEFSTVRAMSGVGAASLRKTGYEIIQALKVVQPQNDNRVYQYLIKKENEGKPLKVAKIAALNNF